MAKTDGILWNIRLFGGPTLESPLLSAPSQSHFRSSKVAALLSYLALHFEKPCSREALIDALWPDEIDSHTLQNRFRVTLASLRKQLEPQGFPYGSVLDTSVPGCVGLRKGATWCDLHAFDLAHKQKDYGYAAELLQAPLMPAIYDEWASADQIRIELLRDDLASFVSQNIVAESDYELESIGHRLPLFLSQFFGRESELQAIGTLIESARLVTITGPGGVGKTRLSVEVCKESSRKTVFVSLSDCFDRDSLAESVLRQLAIGSHTTQNSQDQILSVLRQIGEMRLIIDNAEHLLEDIRDFVELLLSQTPNLRILVTSRQPLEIMGEQIFRLSPFEAPQDTDIVLEKYAATQLFLDRTRQSRPDFQANSSQAKEIVEICQRLEGLPLAIELAAAQITVQSITEILSRLNVSLVDLKSRRRTLSSRHRSLRAAIESSLDGLDPESDRLLGQLSAFWGGFTVDHASEVTGDPVAIERIEDLVMRSLVSSQVVNGKMRFSCLEMIRQIAQERLSSEIAKEAVDQHAKYFMSLAAKVDENDMRTAIPLDDESFNLTAAFQNSDPMDDDFWNASRGAILHAFIRGEHRTGLKWIQEYFPQIEACSVYEFKRDWCNAALQILPDIQRYQESSEIIELTKSLAGQNSDDIGMVYAQIYEGLIAARLGNSDQALHLHRGAFRQAGHLRSELLLECALSHLSGTLHEIARTSTISPEDRIAVLRESEAHAHHLISLVSPLSRRHPLARLLAGVAMLYLGKLDLASAHFGEALSSAERLGIRSVSMYVAYFESEIAHKNGNTELEKQKQSTFERLKEQTGIQFTL